MHITISNYEDVPRIQQQRKLTKILTLIEPFCHVPYHDFGPDLLAQTYIHRIGVSDHEQPIGHYSPNQERTSWWREMDSNQRYALPYCLGRSQRRPYRRLLRLED